CDTGFGNRLAYRLNAMGFKVYATVLDKESVGAKYLLDNCLFKDRLKILAMNVTKRDDIDDVYTVVERDLIDNTESLYAIVNNAGITHLGHVDWGQMEGYKNVINVNTFGTVAVTLKFLPLIRHSKGRIVFMSSVNGRMTFQKASHYCMSKHAITAFSDALRRELSRQWGVQVSTIEPAFYRTPLLADNNYKRVMDREWERTDTAVKEVYGQSYFESMGKMAQSIDYFVGNRIDDVVDNIVDRERTPSEWFDTIYNLIEKITFRYESIEKV
ncbi:unnamed protein product, partial [Oppiella nova]